MPTHTVDRDVEPNLRQPAAPTAAHSLADPFVATRDAQANWCRVSVKERLRLLRRIRHEIVRHADRLTSSVDLPQRRGAAETLAAELIPLADACRFLELQAARILAPRRLSRRTRPLWLRGVSVELRRDPFGLVLIIGPSNYPLFLPGVQTLQALVAGNAVCIKPGIGSSRAACALVDTFVSAGLDRSLVQLLPEGLDEVHRAIQAGVNKVVLTGSADTGRSVQSLLASSLTPATMELSGCDAVFVLPRADLHRVARCLAFGLRFNDSATCIAPRRVFMPRGVEASKLEAELRDALTCSAVDKPKPSSTPTSADTLELIVDAIARGARVVTGGIVGEAGARRLAGPTILADTHPEMNLLRADVFAPVLSLVPVATVEESLAAHRACPYALGAAVFGPAFEAHSLARQIDAGCVVINDLIAPTADPRVPFGGRRQSGFGVTRGAAGLEEMTQLKAIIHRHGSWLPHLDETTPFDATLLHGFLGMTHGGTWRERFHGAYAAVRAAVEQRKWQRGNHLVGRIEDVQ